MTRLQRPTLVAILALLALMAAWPAQACRSVADPDPWDDEPDVIFPDGTL